MSRLSGQRERALPIAIAAAAFVLHWLEGRGISTAWLLPDEVQAAQSGRALAGRADDSAGWTLYSFLTAPLWLLGPAAGYAAVKVVGAALVSLVAFPAYALARRVGPPWLAALCALGSVAAPATVFASAVAPVALAYPLVAASSWAAVGGRAAVALGTACCAVWAWPPAACVAIVTGLAPLVARFGHRLVRWPGSSVLVVLAGGAYALYWLVRPHSDTLTTAAKAGVGAVAASALSGAGSVALGLAVLAFGAAIVGGIALARARRAEGWIGLAALVTGAIGSGLLAQASGLAGRAVDERCLLLVVPLALALAAATASYRPSRAEVAVGALATLVCIGFAQRVDWRGTIASAPGLALARPLGLAPWALALFVVGAVALVAVAFRLVHRRAWLVVVGGCLAVLLAGEITAAARAGSRADRLARSLPSPRVLPGGTTRPGLTLLSTPGDSSADALSELRFWNPRADVANPPLAQRSLAPDTGLYTPPLSPGTLYLSPEGAVAGTVVARTPDGAVVRPSNPVRAAQTLEGGYPDGWTGPRAVYRRFDASRPGTLRVTLSRAAWGGPPVPDRVTVLLGPLGGTPTVTRALRVPAGHKAVLDLPTPALPFSVEIDSQTFSPSAFGQPDKRQLGVQAAFDYRSSGS